MKRVFTYIRVSQERNNMFSPQIQKEKVELYCKERNWTVAEVFEDIDYSGRNTERPAYRNMMSQLDQCDVVVVYKTTRFGRSRKNFWEGLETLQKHNVGFVAVTQQFDTTTAAGRLMLGLLVDMSQFESDLISEHWKDAQLYLVRNGMYRGGCPPYGFVNDKEKKKLVPVPSEAKTVKLIVKRCLLGFSLRQIAFELNKQRIPTKNGGSGWNSSLVGKVLDNPHIIGKAKLNGEYFDNHDRIIGLDTWEKVQAIRRKAKRFPARHKNVTYPLSGLLKCGLCGRNLVVCDMYKEKSRRIQVVKTYRCYRNAYQSTCKGVWLRVHIAEDYVKAAFFSRIDVDRLNELTQKEIKKLPVKNKTKEMQLKKELRSVQNAIKRLFASYFDRPDPIITSKQFEKKNKELTAREGELKKELEQEKDKRHIQELERKNFILSIKKAFKAQKIWDKLDPQEQKQIYGLFINQILVERGKGNQRLKIEWKF